MNNSESSKNLTVIPGESEEDDHHHHHCGWCCLKPRCLQRWANPRSILFWLCMFACIQGMTINGLVNVSITSLEARFNFTSLYSGLIAGFFDLGIILCIVLVTYFGEHGNKPKFLSAGVFVMGIGSIVYAIPHFTTGLYDYGSGDSEEFCPPPAVRAAAAADAAESNATSSAVVDQCASSSAQEESNISKYLGVFLAAQILHGAGACPLYTLGITYMDENVKPKNVPVYIGLFYAIAVFGPAIGYLLGSFFISYWTDIGQVDLDSVGIDASSIEFVGAWWIGFLLTGCLSILISVPLFAFPKMLPAAAKWKETKVSETHHSKHTRLTEDEGFGKSIKDLPTSLKILFANGPFICICLAESMGFATIIGLGVFSGKYLETRFFAKRNGAALLVGIIAVVGGVIGNISGGFLIKHLKLSVTGALKLCLIGVFLSTLFRGCILVPCTNIPFAGITEPASPAATSESIDLSGQCNAGCGCGTIDYNPVCGIQNSLVERTYFSPCFAGCVAFVPLVNKTIDEAYVFCSCVEGEDKVAIPGTCQAECKFLPLFMVLIILASIFGFLEIPASISATIRCVPEKQKSFGLGIKSILVRCIGSIPGPIIFGAVVDKSCLLWEDNSCGNSSNCLFYDSDKMSLYIYIIVLGFAALEFLFYSIAICLYKSPPSDLNLTDDKLKKPEFISDIYTINGASPATKL